ncbi:MAG: family 43 glycosylhydrolase [Candidatus Sumerlaeota bacterium]
MIPLLAGIAAASGDSPRLLGGSQGLPVGLKDPAVAEFAFPGISDKPVPFLFLGAYWQNKIRAFPLRGSDFDLREEIAITMPPCLPGLERWAPCLLVDGETLWMYYAMGKQGREGIEWSTFRIYVAKATIPATATARELSFTDEKEVVLLDQNQYDGAKDYGIIDPEIFRDDDGSLYMYYNVVLDGIPTLRNRGSAILSQRMHDPMTAFGQKDQKLVVHDTAGDQGVVETPSILKSGDEYLLFYSSRASDFQQCIVMLRSEKPHGAPWTDRRVVLSTRPEDEPAQLATAPWERKGVGGQCVLERQHKPYLIYQGLGVIAVDNPKAHDGFRAAIMKIPNDIMKNDGRKSSSNTEKKPRETRRDESKP